VHVSHMIIIARLEYSLRNRAHDTLWFIYDGKQYYSAPAILVTWIRLSLQNFSIVGSISDMYCTLID